MSDIWSKLSRMYRHQFYPNFRDVRGATRLGKILRTIAYRSIEDIDSEPEPITDFEWDNLIIIDACRHDLFEEVEGKTGSRITVGSMTPEFINKTFSEGDWSDTVLVTANPHFSRELFSEETGRNPEDVFHEVFHTYKTDWDEEEKTVLPEAVVRDAETAAKLFPDKKLIIHFMQPHVPFIGYNFNERSSFGIREERYVPDAWDLAEMGELAHVDVKEAYKENLEKVMPSVKELSEQLSGKTLLTSDHGNLVGENGLYGHPRGNSATVLRKVPCKFI